MKKLSEFDDEYGIKVIGKLMMPISKMVKATKDKGEELDSLERFGIMLQECPTEAKTIMAILNEKEPSEYHCNMLELLHDITELMNDPELVSLFK